MRPDVAHWFNRRTSRAADWPLADVRAAKRGRTVSVVLPALDEEETVGDIVTAVVDDLAGPHGLVDEVVVMDSGSTDRTAAVAGQAGARVVARDEVLPRVAPRPGKGEVMWRSLAATTGDVLVFVDADLREFSSDLVVGLLGPLLTDPTVHLVKATYDRPLETGATVLPAGGGRVTELVARPLLNLHWPELAGVVQPLAGEYAARRDLLERLPFPCGYGVELALLVDTLHAVGLDGIAQVDVGVRRHRHRGDRELGRMAAAILQAAHARLPHGEHVRGDGTRVHTALTQFSRDAGGYQVEVTDVAAHERPPMETVPEYGQARAS